MTQSRTRNNGPIRKGIVIAKEKENKAADAIQGKDRGME